MYFNQNNIYFQDYACWEGVLLESQKQLKNKLISASNRFKLQYTIPRTPSKPHHLKPIIMYNIIPGSKPQAAPLALALSLALPFALVLRLLRTLPFPHVEYSGELEGIPEHPVYPFEGLGSPTSVAVQMGVVLT